MSKIDWVLVIIIGYILLSIITSFTKIVIGAIIVAIFVIIFIKINNLFKEGKL